MAEIRAIRTERVTVALRERFRTAVRSTDRVDALRIELTDSDGALGVGFATATPAITGDTLDGMESFVRTVAGPRVLGHAVDGALLADLSLLAEESPSGTAGLDLSLHALRDRGTAPIPASVMTSVTVSAADVDRMVDAARSRIDEGFRVVKIKLGVDPSGDAERLRRIVEATRGRADVWVDANQGWTLHETLTILEGALAGGYAPTMLEQPVRAEAFDELDRIAREIPLPVTADESARTLADVERIADGGAVRAVNIKLMKFGGLTGSTIAARRAGERGLAVLVGSMMEHPESVAAAVRFAFRLDQAYRGGIGVADSARHTDDMVHDLDAAWWMAAAGPCRYEHGRVHA